MDLFTNIVKSLFPFTISAKAFILDVSQGSEYPSDLPPKLNVFHVEINLNVKGKK